MIALERTRADTAASSTASQEITMPDRFLKLREVIAMTGLSRTTIYRKMGEGSFPKPFGLSPACVRWRETHIISWMGGFQQRAS